MPLMRLGEPSLPTPFVLAVAAQPTAKVEIQESTIWDGSSDGEPLVRPNNGRHVASRIGDTVRDRSVYCGRFSVLSEDTANSVHSGTRQLSLMSGGLPVTQLDAVSPHEAPMEVSHFNLAQSDTVSPVTEAKDGFDDDPAEEDDVVSEGGLEILNDQESEVEIPFRLPGAMARRRGFESLDGVSLVEEFDERACLMKTVPCFLKGPYRIVLSTILEEINVEDLGQQERGWKLFLLLPRLCSIAAQEAEPSPSRSCGVDLRSSIRVRGWIFWKRVGRSPMKQLKFVGAGIGELRMISRGGSAELKPWCTWERCRQPDKLPSTSRARFRSHTERTQGPCQATSRATDSTAEGSLESCRPHSVDASPQQRSAKRGAAGGPSGMTVEHLQILLDMLRDARAFFQACEKLCRAQVPVPIRDAIGLGRLTALQKPNGGVRGIVAGDIVRRLVARTMSQQMMEKVQAATAPFQYAMATKSGCECIAHALQGLTEIDARVTVMSIDGISAFDLISRQAMLQGLMDLLSLLSHCFSAPSSYLWEDSCGRTRTILQGEGGEQGDAMMPLLFSSAQHSALAAVQAQMEDGEVLLAFHDDIYTVTMPERVGEVHALLEGALWTNAGIRVHQVRGAASMPLVLGGAGLRSALRVREPAYWSSWMDCLPTIHKRHPMVANQLVDELEGQPTTPFLSAAAEATRNLTGTLGFDPPSWQAALHGTRPPPRNPERISSQGPSGKVGSTKQVLLSLSSARRCSLTVGPGTSFDPFSNWPRSRVSVDCPSHRQ